LHLAQAFRSGSLNFRSSMRNSGYAAATSAIQEGEMRAKFIGILATALLALAAFGSTSASAATEVGTSCAAETGTTGLTLASLATAGPMPAKVPSAGVITRWTFRNGLALPPGFNQALKVFRSTGAPTQYQVIGESAASAVTTGANTFNTRIPVQAGDFLGASGTYEGTVYTFFCITGSPTDRYAFFVGSPTVGPVTSVAEAEGLQAPVSAIVEPDADNDGFGDETQDQCPQSAALQIPCPTAALSVSSVVRKGFARVLVTTNTQASVTVAGTVKLGKGKTAKLSGSSQVVVPGTIAKFTLIFPGGLKEKLKELSRKQSLRLVLTATATNIVGAPTVSTLKAKVKGQKKPVRKGKKGGKQG
jgi:hypothetical protein